MWITGLLKQYEKKPEFRLMKRSYDRTGLMQIGSKDIIFGTAYKLLEKIQLSDTVLPVNVISRENISSYSVFPASNESNPNIMVTIGKRSVLFCKLNVKCNNISHYS
jgi:hypothetical protein